LVDCDVCSWRLDVCHLPFAGGRRVEVDSVLSTGQAKRNSGGAS
jgi:hypothetical protein